MTYDPEHPNDPIPAIYFTDAHRRNQVKTRIVENGFTVMSVSGYTMYDELGRTIEQHLPCTESIGTHNYLYNSYCSGSKMPTRFEYDAMDRAIRTILPDDSESTVKYSFDYDFSGRYCFTATNFDANNNEVTSYTDANGLQTMIVAPLNTVTRFKYNLLGELVESIDPENLSTHFAYDMLGNMIVKTHPDSGTDLYEYDLLGNLIARQTQNLQNSGGKISYKYHYNQLISIHYPENPQNDIYYVYGDPGKPDHVAANAVGRLYFVEDDLGWQQFKYGKQGEVIEQTRTFALPGSSSKDTITYRMKFEYDSWNRIQKMTYPDSEVVFYSYNLGGMLRKMQGW